MRNKTQKGITLIALVITIIVLLILAGIVLMSLSGENGILTRAAETSKKWGSAQEYEREEILTLEAKILEQEVELEIETDQEQGSKNEMIAYELDGVPIPKGFTYLEGTRETGLVIMNKKDKNEFVWIPVDEKLRNEIENNNGGEYKNYLYDENLYPESYNLMDSVEYYGGYYMARYKAGADVEITQNGQMEKVYSQPGKHRYVCGSITQMINLCASMYPNDSSNETGAVSTYPLMGMGIGNGHEKKWGKEDLLTLQEWMGSACIIEPIGTMVGWITYELKDGEIKCLSRSISVSNTTCEEIIELNFFNRDICFRPILYIKIPR